LDKDRGRIGADGFGGAAHKQGHESFLGEAVGNERCGADESAQRCTG
jgi:hypothetical protein